MPSLSDIKLAVIGATGKVGVEIAKILQERNYSLHKFFWLASERSHGTVLSINDEKITIQDLSSFDLSTCHACIFSAGAKISKSFAQRAEQAGCWVIDNTSYFRQEPDIALVVPEINFQSIYSTPRRIISNPNCSTIQMVMALAPLEALSPLRRIIVSTYQSVSGAGRRAEEELQNQLRGSTDVVALPRRIAENVIPQIDVFLEDGSTKEEMKMVLETQKILGRKIPVSATCVRVPVVCGHSEAVTFELEDDIPLDVMRKALSSFPGVVVQDALEGYETPLEVVGRDEVFVSRLRKDPSIPHGYQMWVVADNLRKGAALNSLQILDGLLDNDLLKPSSLDT